MWWIGFWPKITISVVHTQLFFTIKKNGQNCHKILQNWIFSFFLPWGLKLLSFMLILLLGQNVFCPGQNWNCPRQNFCPGLKTTFFAFKSHAKWIFVVKNRFPIRKFCFKWLLKAKNVLFNPGQNFYLGQFQFSPGQKIFCPSRRTRQ